MKMILLSAGTGSRLMPLTRNTPKSLIDLGGGFTLLEKQIQSLAPICKDLTIVTGYRSEQIEAKVLHYQDTMNIQILFNPFFKLANNIVSAWLALKDQREECVLINGDVMFKPQILKDLLRTTNPITMVVNRKSIFDEDDMKVILEGDRVRDIGKDLVSTSANAESIGMIYFRKTGLAQMKDMLTRFLKHEENFQMFYLAVLRQLAREDCPIYFSECQSSDWAEIDFHPDLEHMKQHLVQNIQWT